MKSLGTLWQKYESEESQKKRRRQIWFQEKGLRNGLNTEDIIYKNLTWSDGKVGISDVFIYDKNFNPQLLDIGNGGEYEGSIQTVAGGGTLPTRYTSQHSLIKHWIYPNKWIYKNMPGIHDVSYFGISYMKNKSWVIMMLYLVFRMLNVCWPRYLYS